MRDLTKEEKAPIVKDFLFRANAFKLIAYSAVNCNFYKTFITMDPLLFEMKQSNWKNGKRLTLEEFKQLTEFSMGKARLKDVL